MVNLESNSRFILDSLTSQYSKFCRRVVEIMSVVSAIRETRFSLQRVKFSVVNCEKQPNDFDCGTFACLFIERILSNDPSELEFVSVRARDHLRSVISEKSAVECKGCDYLSFNGKVNTVRGLNTAEFNRDSITYSILFKLVVL